MNQYILIKGDANYADEFDCAFLCIKKKDEWESYKKKVSTFFEKNPGSVDIYFGTNEFLDVRDYQDWLRHLEETPLTDEQAEFLIRTLGESYGTGSGYLSILDYTDYSSDFKIKIKALAGETNAKEAAKKRKEKQEQRKFKQLAKLQRELGITTAETSDIR